MKIIRALWGDFLKHHKKDIENSTRLDETVYVWGKENLEYLNALRYDTIYMGDTSGSYELKLQTLDSAYKQFGEILFLDWDCKTELPLDAIKELRLPSPSMPLYSYPSDYNPQWDMVEACSWELHNSRVLPNACFIYTKDTNIGKELLDIVEEYGLEGLPEEFAMYLYANCSLDEYIKRYDTPYLNGREDYQTFVMEGVAVNTAKKLNKYIGKKEILFHHD
tara:strand:+ start:22328 stop:22990 length:663 start_codon:yes stop_codon:yes gene_type:complete